MWVVVAGRSSSQGNGIIRQSGIRTAARGPSDRLDGKAILLLGRGDDSPMILQRSFRPRCQKHHALRRQMRVTSPPI
jgi:hypothetical protein